MNRHSLGQYLTRESQTNHMAAVRLKSNCSCDYKNTKRVTNIRLLEWPLTKVNAEVCPKGAWLCIQTGVLVTLVVINIAQCVLQP